MAELDLNLLRVLVAIDDKRSVSAAAVELQRSQPSVSSALGKLRTFFADPLFIRSGNTMQPTPRVAEIMGPVREVLSRIGTDIVAAPTLRARAQPTADRPRPLRCRRSGLPAVDPAAAAPRSSRGKPAIRESAGGGNRQRARRRQDRSRARLFPESEAAQFFSADFVFRHLYLPDPDGSPGQIFAAVTKTIPATRSCGGAGGKPDRRSHRALPGAPSHPPARDSHHTAFRERAAHRRAVGSGGHGTGAACPIFFDRFRGDPDRTATL